jgi:peptidoglycan/LPS O-acetylase OafA/YrhL
MGILRLYLALCVVAAHTGNLFPWSAHNGLQSVEIFFLISGFYMALIASKYKVAREFYASRFLRIYIPYWSILLGVGVACSVFGLATGKWLELAPYVKYSPDVNGLTGTILAAVSNLTAFGIDWFCFLTHESGGNLQLTADGLHVAHPLSQYVVINPAWSIGVELTFYLFVPWFNRCSTKTLVLLAAVSLGARVIAYEVFGLAYDPWTYRFTPFAMGMFLMGMISCRLSRSSEPGIVRFVEQRVPAAFRRYPVQVMCLLALFWAGLRSTQSLHAVMPVRYADLVSYIGWASIIPAAFAITKSNKLDRWLGELSYPVYLVHYFIVSIIAAVYTRVLWLPLGAKATIVAGISITVSLLILHWVVTPVERRRAQWAKQIAGGIPASAAANEQSAVSVAPNESKLAA